MPTIQGFAVDLLEMWYTKDLAQDLVESSCSISIHKWTGGSRAEGRKEEFRASSAVSRLYRGCPGSS